MLSANVDPASTSFTRSDAGRLVALSALLALVMSIVLGLDVLPAQDQLELGRPAPTNVVAPATREYTSEVLTEQARDAARESVLPQYDFTIARGASIAGQQVREFERTVAPIDAAFAEGVSDEDRATILGGVLTGDLGESARETLGALDADRWQAIRTESARVLDNVERAELRDTDFTLTRDSVEGLFAGDLTEAETALGAALIRPLIVPNSSYSQEITDAARSRAAEAVEDVSKFWERGETIVRAGDRVDAVAWEAIGLYRLNEGGLDVARLVGFGTAAGFRDQFARRRGVSPRAYRQTFRTVRMEAVPADDDAAA